MRWRILSHEFSTAGKDNSGQETCMPPIVCWFETWDVIVFLFADDVKVTAWRIPSRASSAPLTGTTTSGVVRVLPSTSQAGGTNSVPRATWMACTWRGNLNQRWPALNGRRGKVSATHSSLLRWSWNHTTTRKLHVNRTITAYQCLPAWWRWHWLNSVLAIKREKSLHCVDLFDDDLLWFFLLSLRDSHTHWRV